MNEKQWETGEDDEELFEYAMHPAQYEAYRSGKAKVEFKADVAKSKSREANSRPACHRSFTSSPGQYGNGYADNSASNDRRCERPILQGNRSIRRHSECRAPAETQAAPAATPDPRCCSCRYRQRSALAAGRQILPREKCFRHTCQK